jgi:anthranilate phosphoribosyltransferase
MSEFASILRALIAREELGGQTMREAIGAIMDGAWSSAQAGAFLATLAAKGETPSEVVGGARALRERSLRVEHELALVADTCGTGGDGAGTLNVSTTVGLVLAGCGIPVAKHGGRASSSKCGSADVLEALGVAIDDEPPAARKRLERTKFAFLFAPRYHPAMKVAAPVRGDLGVPTLFNLLGPLANPAGATHQVLGVARESQLVLIGEALIELGARAGAVVHGTGGIDEVAGEGITHVFQFSASRARRWILDPMDLGIRAPLSALAGGDPPTNAAALRALLEGERSPRADVIALNAALALLVVERVESLREGLEEARVSMRHGAALAVLEALRRPREPQAG